MNQDIRVGFVIRIGERGRGLEFYLIYDLAVVEVDDAVGVGSIVLGVGYHDDGCSLVVEFTEKIHHLLAVLGVEITRRSFYGIIYGLDGLCRVFLQKGTYRAVKGIPVVLCCSMFLSALT